MVKPTIPPTASPFTGGNTRSTSVHEQQRLQKHYTLSCSTDRASSKCHVPRPQELEKKMGAIPFRKSSFRFVHIIHIRLPTRHNQGHTIHVEQFAGGCCAGMHSGNDTMGTAAKPHSRH